MELKELRVFFAFSSLKFFESVNSFKFHPVTSRLNNFQVAEDMKYGHGAALKMENDVFISFHKLQGGQKTGFGEI